MVCRHGSPSLLQQGVEGILNCVRRPVDAADRLPIANRVHGYGRAHALEFLKEKGARHHRHANPLQTLAYQAHRDPW